MSHDYDDVAEDYAAEQAYHNNLSTIPSAKDGLVARYWRGYDQPDAYTCDCVYIDRVTGAEVLRYDAADPANTCAAYGATPDVERLSRKGMNLKEMVRPEECAVSNDDCRRRMQVYDSYDDYSYDDY